MESVAELIRLHTKPYQLQRLVPSNDTPLAAEAHTGKARTSTEALSVRAVCTRQR